MVTDIDGRLQSLERGVMAVERHQYQRLRIRGYVLCATVVAKILEPPFGFRRSSRTRERISLEPGGP